MKPSVEQLGSLLAVKRQERPDDAYWQDFLCEFHQRQREQAVKKSGFSGWLGASMNWLSDLGPAKWVYGAGLAYAAVTVVYFIAPDSADRSPSPAVPIHRMVEPTRPVEQLEQLDLNPSAEGSVGEQVF